MCKLKSIKKQIHRDCLLRRFQVDISARTGGNCRQISLFVYDQFVTNGLVKFNRKEELTNYLPFSVSYYSPRVHRVQNSQA